MVSVVRHINMTVATTEDTSWVPDLPVPLPSRAELVQRLSSGIEHLRHKNVNIDLLSDTVELLVQEESCRPQNTSFWSHPQTRLLLELRTKKYLINNLDGTLIT